MCGICGWMARPRAPEKMVLERMASTLIHRGPDEGGFFSDDRVGLAIRRLAIVDLAGGKQPYYSEDGSVVAVFNGEIYNFKTVRGELEKRGHSFTTKADGEVLVHLYEEYGKGLVSHLNGMFACAVWDRKHHKLLLARDRLGIKPLYYGTFKGVFYFASEAKAILAAPDVTPRLDPVGLDRYLTFEYVPAPRSIYQGIYKLPPGSTMLIDEKGVEQGKYWSIPFNPGASGKRMGRNGRGRCNERELVEEFWHLLRRSVERRLMSDVPVGAFLSGGLDSSSVVRLMSELHSQRIRTFSIGFREYSYDESKFFRTVASRLGASHQETILDPSTAQDLLCSLLEFLDEPLGDAAIVPTFLLSRFARREVTVVLTGEGADELLAGYPTYLAHRLACFFERLPRALIKGLRWGADMLPVSRRYISFDYKAKRFFRGIGYPVEERHYMWTGSFDAGTKKMLYAPALAKQIDSGIRTELEPHLDALAGLDVLEQAQYLDLHFYLPDDLLVKLDRATMAASLEGRVPFLDHELVEFAAGLPSDLKLKGTEVKRVLKAAATGKLPELVIKRPKKGFGLPVGDWFLGVLRPLLERYLSREAIEKGGIFRGDAVAGMLQRHFEGKVDYRKELWTLLVFQMWAERYL